MKKKLRNAIAATVLFAAPAVLAGGPELAPGEVGYFSGFFVGGTVAYHHTNFDASSTADIMQAVVVPAGTTTDVTVFNTGSLLLDDSSGGVYDGYAGVQGGVGIVFGQQWYLGVVGFNEWGSQKNTSSTSSQTQNNLTTAGSSYSLDTQNNQNLASTTSVSIDNDHGVAAKLGFLVAAQTMLYGKVGAVWADIEVSNDVMLDGQTHLNIVFPDGSAPNNTADAQATVSGSSSGSENKVALLLGVGVEQYIYEDLVSLNIEYDYANFGTVTTTPGALLVTESTTEVGTTQAKGNAKVSTMLAGLNIYFGSSWI